MWVLILVLVCGSEQQPIPQTHCATLMSVDFATQTNCEDAGKKFIAATIGDGHYPGYEAKYPVRSKG